MAKVHIVGGGPAGCMAAITAARGGHKVIVSEKNRQPGNSLCSGLFSKEGLDMLRDLINYRKFVINDIWGANIYFVDELLLIRARHAVGYVCNRAEFDTELAMNAGLEGARIQYGDKVGDKFKYENIIGADGPYSTVARHFDLGMPQRFVSTLKGMVKYPTTDKHIVKVYLSREKFPGFFGWMIPHDEENVEIGVGVELPNDSGLAWKHLLKMLEIKDAPAPQGAVIPIDVCKKTILKDGRKNVLLIGDAAGQVKATTGGGVVFGGLCARIAGNHFTDPLRYDLEWRTRYGADLSIHKLIRDFMNWKDERQLKSFGRRLRRLRFDEYLSKKGSMDRPSRMIHPDVFLHVMKNIGGEE
jgi:flavin-dependent dehydrogenase